MKRFTQLLIATTMVLALTATSWAQDQTQIKERVQTRIEAGIQNANGNAALSQNRVNVRHQFQDKNGDGVCDYFQNGGNRLGKGSNGGYGPGDGTGNMGIGPKDGSGFGPGSGSGTGICDGTGPKGKSGNRAGKR